LNPVLKSLPSGRNGSETRRNPLIKHGASPYHESFKRGEKVVGGKGKYRKMKTRGSASCPKSLLVGGKKTSGVGALGIKNENESCRGLFRGKKGGSVLTEKKFVVQLKGIISELPESRSFCGGEGRSLGARDQKNYKSP